MQCEAIITRYNVQDSWSGRPKATFVFQQIIYAGSPSVANPFSFSITAPFGSSGELIDAMNERRVFEFSLAPKPESGKVLEASAIDFSNPFDALDDLDAGA